MPKVTLDHYRYTLEGSMSEIINSIRMISRPQQIPTQNNLRPVQSAHKWRNPRYQRRQQDSSPYQLSAASSMSRITQVDEVEPMEVAQELAIEQATIASRPTTVLDTVREQATGQKEVEPTTSNPKLSYAEAVVGEGKQISPEEKKADRLASLRSKLQEEEKRKAKLIKNAQQK